MRVISLDGTEYLRLEHDTLTGIPGGIPLHSDGHHRFGPVKVAGGWYLIGDFTSPEQLEKYVRLSELEESKGRGQPHKNMGDGAGLAGRRRK